MSIEVVVCASLAITREGLRTMLSAAPRVSVVEVVTDPRDCFAARRTTHSDLVVADLSATTREPGEMTPWLRAGSETCPPVLVVSHETTAAATNALLEAGVRGVVASDADSVEMIRAVETVASGNIYVMPSLAGDLINWLRARTAIVDRVLQVRAQTLTRREREILVTLALGNSLDDTARTLFISSSTVRTHLYRIRQKLYVRDRAELVSFAFRAGIVSPVDGPAAPAAAG
ncbi:response regulator transcription factor [Streptomyces sp. MP131-18]|uniref:LuxR C-terminal-related transcriptional regulator n=1 Tax=Streptomyces sp. MP131-18 TaxID=1857892 RepID=UPI00097C09F5|nr:response regulator transcription factor [Streptomyces sp. MP131-18]ONK10471.1 Protease production enhancer protein [Streptomyces sp. MP131-18]